MPNKPYGYYEDDPFVTPFQRALEERQAKLKNLKRIGWRFELTSGQRLRLDFVNLCVGHFDGVFGDNQDFQLIARLEALLDSVMSYL